LSELQTYIIAAIHVCLQFGRGPIFRST